MDVQFTVAESAFCPKLKTREGHETHISQPHFPNTSLPGPSKPLTISSFPIPVRSETAVFRPREIANIWLQLLAIQVQNGNFWSYDDAVKLSVDKASPKDQVTQVTQVPEAAIINPQSYSKPVEDPTINVMNEKSVLFLRHVLQKGFLSQDKSSKETNVSELSRSLEVLEEAPDLEIRTIKATKIHKVLIAICKLDSIPGDQDFNIRLRCEGLITKWQKLAETYDPVEEAERTAKLATETSPATLPVIPKPSPSIAGDADQTPPVCIVQLTSDECLNIQDLAKTCDPPLDRAVVELMCMLPRFQSKFERQAYQIGPSARIYDTFEGLRRNPKDERRFQGWGAEMPQHVLQLTEFSGQGYGTGLYVDTKTGEALIMNEYAVIDPDERDVKWEHLVFERKPIEELLKEWIDCFLNGIFIPASGGDIFEEGPRRMSHRRMDFLRHKTLLGEFGWPESFPLKAPQYHEFLRRQNDLHEITFHNNPRHTQAMYCKWLNAIHDSSFVKDWFLSANEVHKRELTAALDRRIREALEHHENRVEERRYALAADVPMLQDVIQPLSLYASCSIGDGWRVDVSPEMILERFEEVCSKCRRHLDEDTEKMRSVLSKAYERQKLAQQGIYERDYWSEEDDDSSSDFDPEGAEMDEDEDDVEEEYESDDMEDLDLDDLKKDMENDVEVLKAGLEHYGAGSE